MTFNALLTFAYFFLTLNPFFFLEAIALEQAKTAKQKLAEKSPGFLFGSPSTRMTVRKKIDEEDATDEVFGDESDENTSMSVAIDIMNED